MTDIALLILTLAVVLVVTVAREAVLFHRWLVHLRRIRTLHTPDLGRRSIHIVSPGALEPVNPTFSRRLHAPESPTRSVKNRTIRRLPQRKPGLDLRHSGLRVQATHADRH